jgi:serine/threonine-protein kinase
MGQPADTRSDLYSVGVLLYLTLTGKLPFDAQNDIQVLVAKARSEPLPPSRVNPVISTELDQIVLKALRKDPGQRFASANEFRAALAVADPVQTSSKLVINKPNQELFQESQIPHHPQRPSIVPWVFGFFVVAIGVAIIVWLAIH